MHVKYNIQKIYILKALTWFMLSMPIIVLFFQQNNLSLTEIMFLQGLYSLSIALFEIPSGYIADIYGRKKSIILSTLLSFCGYLFFCLDNSFYSFCMAEILIGIGASLISGSDSALLYDTLIQTKNKNSYTKFEGRSYAIGNFSEAIAGITGGFLAVISIYLPVYIQTIVLFFSIPVAFSLKETNVVKKDRKKKTHKNILEIIKYVINENHKLKWLIIYSSSMGVATLSMAWLAQPLFKYINTPLVYFGILWAALNFSAGITSFNAHLIYKNIQKNKILLIIGVFMSILFFMISLNNTYYVLIFVFIIYLIRGLVTPLLRNEINIITESNKRATVLSIRSFVIRISFAIVAPLLGYIGENFKLSVAFVTIGIIAGIFSILSSIKLKNLD